MGTLVHVCTIYSAGLSQEQRGEKKKKRLTRPRGLVNTVNVTITQYVRGTTRTKGYKKGNIDRISCHEGPPTTHHCATQSRPLQYAPLVENIISQMRRIGLQNRLNLSRIISEVF